MTTFHDFSAKTIDGADRALADYKGNAVLVVNVASACGFTPQYAGLQKLHAELGGRGLTVIGFPCNQFGAQEPGSADEIKTFCETSYGVKFPLMAKIDVNGPAAHPLYAWLRAGTGDKDVKWNFEKFLIAPDGQIAGRYSSRVAPDDAELRKAIDAALTTASR
jgi:glutathione peroxidase